MAYKLLQNIPNHFHLFTREFIRKVTVFATHAKCTVIQFYFLTLITHAKCIVIQFYFLILIKANLFFRSLQNFFLLEDRFYFNVCLYIFVDFELTKHDAA